MRVARSIDLTMSSHLRHDTVVARREGFIESFVGDELAGLHIESGNIYWFNPTATRVWQLLEQPMTLAGLCAALGAEYAVDPQTCEADIREVLQDLCADALIDLK